MGCQRLPYKKEETLFTLHRGGAETTLQGAKGEYEVSNFLDVKENHLGNVQVVISDRRMMESDGTTWTERVEVVSSTEYYAGGMSVKSRSLSGSYRYGAGGQEKVDEISGSGNHYTAEYWEMDPRIGRRWNLDPMAPKYAYQSPYAAFNNNPVYFSDPTGLEGEGEGEGDKPLSTENQSFINSSKKFVNDEIDSYEKKLNTLEETYKKKNWAIDKTKGKFKVYAERIEVLKSIKRDIEYIENTAKKNGGDALLTLANVVYNESGDYNSEAKTAIAYAYLNRIGYSGDGSIREPIGNSEISHYSELNDRWSSFSSVSEKMEFLQSFRSSFDAANTRLTSSGSDPTNGATHWVSPIALPTSPVAGYYLRTYDGLKRYFPNWARSNEWVKNNQKDAKKWFDVTKYQEMSVKGVSGQNFLFYKGVKY